MADTQVQELATIFASTLNAETVQTAYQWLDQNCTQPGFATLLFKLTVDSSFADDIRVAGCTYLKNRIEKYMTSYTAMLSNCRDEAEMIAQLATNMNVAATVLPHSDFEVIQQNSLLSYATASSPRLRALFKQILKLVINTCISVGTWQTLPDEIIQYLGLSERNYIDAGAVALSFSFACIAISNEESHMRLTSLWIEKLYPTLMSHLHHALNSAYDEDLFITTGILLKCFSHLIAFNLPPFLTSDINIVSDWLITIINLSKVEVPAAIALTPMKDEHECYGVWKTKKWALEFLKRVFLRYGFVNDAAIEFKAFAERYSSLIAPMVFKSIIEEFDKVSAGTLKLEEKYYSICLQYLYKGVYLNDCWKILRRQLTPLLLNHLLPLLKFTPMDEEDFEEDPTRFFSFYNDTDISYSGMDIHATNLLIEMCYRRGKRVIPLLYQCLQDIGTNNPAPTPAESPTVADKYAALRAIGTVSDTLRRRKQFTQHVPYLIQTYVLPEFFSTSPLIRFAACWAFSECFDDRLEDGLLSSCIEQLYIMSHDSSVVVAAMAYVAIKGIVKTSEKGQELIRPHLEALLTNILQLANVVRSDLLWDCLHEFVSEYKQEVLQFCTTLCTKLVEAFHQAVNTETEEEDDVSAEIPTRSLQVIETMLDAFDSDDFEYYENEEAYKNLEVIIAPLIMYIQEHYLDDYIEQAISLSTLLVENQQTLSANMAVIMNKFMEDIVSHYMSYYIEIMDFLRTAITQDFETITKLPLFSVIVKTLHNVLSCPEGEREVGENERSASCRVYQTIFLVAFEQELEISDEITNFVLASVSPRALLIQPSKLKYVPVRCVCTILACFMKVPITTFAFLVQNYSLYQLIQSLEEQKPQMNTKRDSQLIIHAFLRLLSMPIPDLFDRIAGELPLIGNLLNFHALQIHKLDHEEAHTKERMNRLLAESDEGYVIDDDDEETVPRNIQNDGQDEEDDGTAGLSSDHHLQHLIGKIQAANEFVQPQGNIFEDDDDDFDDDNDHDAEAWDSIDELTEENDAMIFFYQFLAAPDNQSLHHALFSHVDYNKLKSSVDERASALLNKTATKANASGFSFGAAPAPALTIQPNFKFGQ